MAAAERDEPAEHEESAGRRWTTKGEARRTALLDAALVVLERDGAGAVTHRAVAQQAGVPVASATYYFTDLDELFISALRRATDQQQELTTGLAGRSLPEVARVLHRWAFADRTATVAQYELMFLAMRRHALRADADLWYAALEAALTRDDVPAAATRTLALAIDGLLLRMLWRAEPDTVAGVEDALRELFATTGVPTDTLGS